MAESLSHLTSRYIEIYRFDIGITAERQHNKNGLLVAGWNLVDLVQNLASKWRQMFTLDVCQSRPASLL